MAAFHLVRELSSYPWVHGAHATLFRSLNMLQGRLLLTVMHEGRLLTIIVFIITSNDSLALVRLATIPWHARQFFLRR